MFLASQTADGFPDVRALALGAADGTDTIWFSTSMVSKKVRQLAANPRASIYGVDFEGYSEIRLFGTVEILTDMESKKKVWKDGYTEYWPDGIESPDMGVLKFTTLRGEYSSVSGKGTF